MNLRFYRTKAGLTQNDLSVKLGLGAHNGQYISNVERGMAFISTKHFLKLSKALNVSISVLVDEHMKAYESRLKKKLKI